MLSKVLFESSIETARACRDHPFVRGIEDGSLGKEAFRSYVAQDAFYLESFARAYAVAAARSPSMEDFSVFVELMKGVEEELRLHAGFAQSLSIDLDRVTPLPAVLAYTDFLEATAWHEGIGPTVAAMAPCMRLYAWLGQALAGDGIPDHRYADWIRTYSSKEFGDLADLLDGLVDRLAADTPKVRAAFAKAMRLEYEFFDSF